jgi:hypothetical protein
MMRYLVICFAMMGCGVEAGSSQPTDDRAAAPASVEVGCLAPDVFAAKVVPLLGQDCATCHAGPGAATSTGLDITGFNASPGSPQFALSCDRVLGHADLSHPSDSQLITVVDHATSGDHTLTFLSPAATQTYERVIVEWLEAEAAAR